MHRAIWERHNGPIPDGFTIDHIRHGEFGALDNRLSNLRLASKTEQHWNYQKMTNCSRMYRGVSWSKTQNCWRAKLEHKGQTVFLETFSDEIEAAKAWDAKAIEVRGPTYTKLNFPS